MNLTAVIELLGTALMVLTPLFYSYQLLYLLIPMFRKPASHPDAPPKRYAVLIAARNEETVLPYLLDSIAAQDYPASCVTTYVVADNCTDRTAQVAREHGARVFQRFNTEKIGKGYALNDLLRQIGLWDGLESYDAFLVFDADNLLKKDYVNQINKLCAAGFPAFCGYRNSKNYGDNWISAGYGLWYIHESTHMNRSRMTLGSCCAVSGTGFGFTRELLTKMGGWNYFTLTEDIEFGTWCATHGIRIGYCHDAVLYDEQPTDFSTSIRQRTRWIQGGIQVSIRYARDLVKGIFQGGKTGWASFETATLGLWGYGLGTVSWGFAMLSAFLMGRWGGLGLSVVKAVLGGYCSLFAMGALTMALEWRRIRASRVQKIGYLFTFPLFMFTYIPIAIVSLFRKPQWKPIAHTRALTAAQMDSFR